MFHIWSSTTAMPRKWQESARHFMSKVCVEENWWDTANSLTTDVADVLHLPSVKLHLSQPEEGGVLHGETPSSPPMTIIKKIKNELSSVVFFFSKT